MPFAKDLEIASDPSTESEILAGLERSPDPAIREALTSNPNTPAEVLLRLGAEFPAQLLDNPLFALLLLENPNIATTIPLDTLKSLVKQENVPTAFIVEYALKASDRESLLELTFKLNLPRNALERLVKASDAEIAQAARLHVNWCAGIELGSQAESEEAIQATRQQKISHNDLQALKWLAQLGIIPDFMAQVWAEDSINGDLLVEISKSTNISSSLARKLANSGSSKIRIAIAGNPATPSELLEQLSKDSELAILRALAANPATPPKLLETFAENKDDRIRSSIASNPSTPLHILKRLARDVSQVRQALARNLNTPLRAIKDLSKSRPIMPEILQNMDFWEMTGEKIARNLSSLSVEERLSLAQSPFTPPQILDLLAEDKSPLCQDSSLPRYDPRPHISMEVARNPNTRVNTFIKMARDPDKDLRGEFLAGFSANPTICPYDLILLSRDRNFHMAVAAHPKIPLELMKIYISTRNTDLYRYLVQNPNTPADILAQISADTPKNNFHILRSIAKHPQTPRRILEELMQLQDLHSWLKANPNLPEDLSEQLMSPREILDVLAHRYIEQNHPDALTWALRYFARFDSQILNLVIMCHDRADAEFLAVRANSRCWLERWAIAKHPKTPERILEKLTQDPNRIVRQNAIAHLKYKSEC